MAEMNVEGDLFVSGDILRSASSAFSPGIAQTEMVQRDVQVYPLPLENFRVFDAYGTVLPGASASDDLGLYAGAYGTGCPNIATGDVKTLTVAGRKARVMVQIPREFVQGQRIFLRAYAGMLTTTASVAATIDFIAYKAGMDALVSGSDLVTTAPTTINSLTFAVKDFGLDTATLQAGDWLDVQMTIATEDSATVTAVIAAVAAVQLVCDVKP